MKRATILGLIIASQAFAGGTGSVEGTIVDSQTGKVASGVTVSIACGSLRKAAATDASGHFVIDGLPEGACTLTTGGASYGPASVSVTVTGGSIATILVNVMSKAAFDQMQQAQERALSSWPMPTNASTNRSHARQRVVMALPPPGLKAGVEAAARNAWSTRAGTRSRCTPRFAYEEAALRYTCDDRTVESKAGFFSSARSMPSIAASMSASGVPGTVFSTLNRSSQAWKSAGHCLTQAAFASSRARI